MCEAYHQICAGMQGMINPGSRERCSLGRDDKRSD
jgi:hypothetical protein